MKTVEKKNLIEYFILKLSFLTLTLLTGGILFSLWGKFIFFAQWLTPGILIFFLSLSVFKLFKNKGEWSVNKYEVLIIILLILFSLFNAYFFHKNLGATRDYGGYVANAVTLSEEGGIEVDPENNYSVISQSVFSNKFVLGRIIGYPVYLALFYFWGSLPGMFLANGLLFFLTLSIFYFLGKRLKNRTVGILFVVFFALNYLTIYFTRRTLSENLMVFLFWLAAYLFLKAVQEKKYHLLSWAFLPVFLILLVRAEGILFLGSFIFVFFILIRRERFKWSKVFCKKAAIILLLIMYILAHYVIFYFPPSYSQITNMVNFISKSFTGLVSDSSSEYDEDLDILDGSFNGDKVAKVPTKIENLKYVFAILSFYFILPFILIVLIGFYRGNFNVNILLITLLAAPSFIYLYDPLIARDQPWALRRFWPIFIPFVMLLSAYFLNKFWHLMEKMKSKMKIISYLIILLIIAFNLYFVSKIIFYKENRLQDLQLKNISANFSKDDIVVLPDDYFDPIGRYSSILKYHYGLKNIIWPAYHEKKSPLVDLGSINNLLRNESQKDIYVISPIHRSKGEQIHILFNNYELEYQGYFDFGFSRLVVPRNETFYPPSVPQITEKSYYIYKFKNG